MAPPVGSDGNTFDCLLGGVVDYTSSIRGKRGALGAKQPSDGANSLSIKPCSVAGR